MEIYSGAPDYILKRIITLQKKMIRSINALPYNAHTRIFFNSLNVLKVNVIHFFSVSKRLFKFIWKQAFITHSELLPYNMRNEDNRIHPFFHLTKSQKAPTYRRIRTWKSLLNHIRASNNMNTFKSKPKENSILQY